MGQMGFFVAVKGPEQQSVLMVHRTRELLVRQRTMLVNAIRAHMAAYGIVAPAGIPRVKELVAVIADGDDERLPAIARACSKVWRDSSCRSTRRFTPPRGASSPGIARTRPADAWRPSPASDRSSPAP